MATKPPPGLSERSRQIWEHGRAKSAGRLALLEECCRHLDKADELRAVIAREGMVTKTKTTGATHINPLVKVEQAHRAQFVKLAKMLGLEWDMTRDGLADE